MFKEIPANNYSTGRRKTISGVGINDANYKVAYVNNGKHKMCPIYMVWKAMLNRCYNQNYWVTRPRYKGCTVCDAWLVFSVFKAWMDTQDWPDKALDKDILLSGNKHYSPETCVFVTPELNNLLCSATAIRGKYPQGVSFDKERNKYKAYITIYGVSKFIGRYASIDLAESAYKRTKAAYIIGIANTQSRRVKSALLRHAEALSC